MAIPGIAGIGHAKFARLHFLRRSQRDHSLPRAASSDRAKKSQRLPPVCSAARQASGVQPRRQPRVTVLHYSLCWTRKKFPHQIGGVHVLVAEAPAFNGKILGFSAGMRPEMSGAIK
jgi:hypothetical protein